MLPSPRKYIVGGNWKCNGSIESIMDLLDNVIGKATFDTERLDVVIAPGSIHTGIVKSLVN